MRSGAIYDPADAELLPYQLSRINRVNAYNRIPATPKGLKKREKLLKELLMNLKTLKLYIQFI